MTSISIESAEHYVWGGQCDGWHLLKDDKLSVIQERVPPGLSEVRHRHQVSQQFFYILKGTATMELAGFEHTIEAGHGLHIPAGAPHRFMNRGAEPVEFLVISQPTTRGDRENLDA